MKLALELTEGKPTDIELSDLTIFTGETHQWEGSLMKALERAKTQDGKFWNGMICTAPSADYDEFYRDVNGRGLNPTLTDHLETILNGKYVMSSNRIWWLKSNDYELGSRIGGYCNAATVNLRTLYLLLRSNLKPDMPVPVVVPVVDPEIGLSLGKQRDMARFIAHMVRMGYKVVLLTNSDVIIIEIGILMSLSRKASDVRKLLKAQPADRKDNLLDYRRVVAYDLQDGKLVKSHRDHDGIAVNSMDEIIREQQILRRQILFGDE